MDYHTTMFNPINENNLDSVVMDEMSPDGVWFETHNFSSSTLFEFSSSFLNPTDEYMSYFDPNISPEEIDIKPFDDHHEFFDDRLIQAVEYLNEICIMDVDLLVQLWLPVVKNGKRVLATENQPFIVNSDNLNLSNYRKVSKIHQFAVDYDSTETIGFPGRVFLKKFPTCTPNLQFVAEENDPRVVSAQELDLYGCLNLPVFELDGETCLGVIEIITTSQRVNFREELKNICKALEVVDLRTSDFLIHPKPKDFAEPYQVAVAEIRDVLRSICKTLKLPLAQTWSPSKSRSIIESASYVFDLQVLGFFEASCAHRLVEGEGTSGKALVTNQPCFTDINDFCRADYPLSHEAKMFGLSGAVAIQVHSNNTGPLDFILEFYLPGDCKSHEEQKKTRDSITSMIKNLSWNLQVIDDASLVKETKTRDESWISDMLEAKRRGENVILSMGCHKEEPGEEFRVVNELYHGLTFSNPEKQTYFEWGSKSRNQSSGNKKASEKNRSKTEKNISLQILQQYFPGSLKDAAKSIGVCPTTLKRICRQHGIMRWPSRKIKKVSHSLKKLQLVIDSVQGAEGMIKLSSFYTNFPELSSPVPPNPKPKVDNRVNVLKTQTTSPSNSSSSCSRGSSCSTEKSHEFVHEETKIQLTAENNKLADIHCSPEIKNSSHVSQDEGVFRVKASFGDEKIRFKMLKNWGFGDLQQEIARRFSIYDMGNITIEYIDDESEWVLLGCDADLEECMDLHASNKNQFIKLFIHQSSQPSFLPIINSNNDIQMW